MIRTTVRLENHSFLDRVLVVTQLNNQDVRVSLFRHDGRMLAFVSEVPAKDCKVFLVGDQSEFWLRDACFDITEDEGREILARIEAIQF